MNSGIRRQYYDDSQSFWNELVEGVRQRPRLSFWDPEERILSEDVSCREFKVHHDRHPDDMVEVGRNMDDPLNHLLSINPSFVPLGQYPWREFLLKFDVRTGTIKAYDTSSAQEISAAEIVKLICEPLERLEGSPPQAQRTPPCLDYDML